MALMVVLLTVVAVGAWFILDGVAEYTDKLKELATTEPNVAAAMISQLLKTISVVNGVFLLILTVLIIQHGLRGWRTAAMPPRGSWILAGQRTWSGEPAIRIAQFTITVGALLGGLAVISSVILWNLGDTLNS